MKWCIALIDFKKIDNIEPSLNKVGIKFELGIPTVTILRKRFKNKDFFDKVPLMFNYGFIRLPNKYAASKDKLLELKEKVPGIFSWMFTNKVKGYAVEIVDASVVERLLNLSDRISVFSKSDIDRISPGDLITLKGYPFDGLPAEVVKVDSKAKKVRVNLFIMEAHREVTVRFENIFYSIYSNFDESVSSNSIDEIDGRYKNSLDKVHHKNLLR